MSPTDWWAFVADRPIVTDDPEKYFSALSLFGCRVIDIGEIKNLPPPELADRIYFAWVDLKLREQHSCHVILRKDGTTALTYTYGMDLIES